MVGWVSHCHVSSTQFDEEVSHLSKLYFQDIITICSHVQHRPFHQCSRLCVCNNSDDILFPLSSSTLKLLASTIELLVEWETHWLKRGFIYRTHGPIAFSLGKDPILNHSVLGAKDVIRRRWQIWQAGRMSRSWESQIFTQLNKIPDSLECKLNTRIIENNIESIEYAGIYITHGFPCRPHQQLEINCISSSHFRNFP